MIYILLLCFFETFSSDRNLKDIHLDNFAISSPNLKNEIIMIDTEFPVADQEKPHQLKKKWQQEQIQNYKITQENLQEPKTRSPKIKRQENTALRDRMRAQILHTTNEHDLNKIETGYISSILKK